VSDALDSLQNKLAELRVRCLALFSAYDAMNDGEDETEEFTAALALLRSEVMGR
jgi:hypothetical protein